MQAGFDDKTAIGKRLRRLSNVIDQDAKRLYEAVGVDFEPRWFGVLNLLVMNGPMTVKDLAASLRITHVSVSETRQSLEAKGIIRAKADKEDNRRKILSLTAKGKRMFEELVPLWEALEEVTIELDKESGRVTAALDRLDAVLGKRSLYDRVAEKMGIPS